MSDSLVAYRERVLDTVRRVGPPQGPTLFGIDRKGKYHVMALAVQDDLAATAQVMVDNLKIVTFVIAATSVDDKSLVLCGQADQGRQSFAELYRLPEMTLVSNSAPFNIFSEVKVVR